MANFAFSSRDQLDFDITLFNDLYEEIDRRPPAIEARKLLIQQCMEVGWIDTARDATKDLLVLDPYDEEAHIWAEILSDGNSTQSQSEAIPTPGIAVSQLLSTQRELVHEQHFPQVNESASDLATRDETQALEKEKGEKGISVMNVLSSIFSFRKKKETTVSSRSESMTTITDLRVNSVVRARQLTSALSVARAMEENSGRAVDIAVEYLEDQTRFLRSQRDHQDNDAVREALVKRVGMISSALPDGMKIQASTALMHVEHELLHRNYVCDETMYGEKVVDIPRARFLVTEDGYPWDMDELAQAIQSNGGVMRNPLSRQMFTTDDIRMILQHPLGKGLAALGVEQGELSRGVRQKTIEELEKLSVVLLADMSGDQRDSRHILDQFLGYVATLPESEQKALNELRVPARDSHTGQGFDSTIGDAVRDARANVVCIHKIGDFLQQAVLHLNKSRCESSLE